VPTEWHIRDDIPVTPAGKVDHKRLSLWIEDQQKAQTWGSIYDEMYFADSFQVRDGEGDPTMDWAAYYDSFTGEMHKRTTIEEWVSETVVEVGLHKPSSVLEMGCGKGMILFKMAALPSVKSLVCCDLSGMAIKHVEKLWAWMHETGHVIGSARQPQKDDPLPINAACSMKTIVREASNFAGVANASMDAIVCNGVAMHFPCRPAWRLNCGSNPKLLTATMRPNWSPQKCTMQNHPPRCGTGEGRSRQILETLVQRQYGVHSLLVLE